MVGCALWNDMRRVRAVDVYAFTFDVYRRQSTQSFRARENRFTSFRRCRTFCITLGWGLYVPVRSSLRTERRARWASFSKPINARTP